MTSPVEITPATMIERRIVLNEGKVIAEENRDGNGNRLLRPQFLSSRSSKVKV